MRPKLGKEKNENKKIKTILTIKRKNTININSKKTKESKSDIRRILKKINKKVNIKAKNMKKVIKTFLE